MIENLVQERSIKGVELYQFCNIYFLDQQQIKINKCKIQGVFKESVIISKIQGFSSALENENKIQGVFKEFNPI